MNYPIRRKNRLSGFDYSTPNVYFITICTHQRMNLFWTSVGATIGRPSALPLSEIGITVQKTIAEIPHRYPAYALENHVIMPNHIHLLLRIQADENGRPMVAPTVSTVVAQMKGAVTKQIGANIWQKSFHDHIVRTAADFQEIWEYIDNNPLKWELDSLYMP